MSKKNCKVKAGFGDLKDDIKKKQIKRAVLSCAALSRLAALQDLVNNLITG